MAACAISLSGAAKVCRQPWESERYARWAAETLAGAGYPVEWWPEPIELEPGTGYWSVATVLTPDAGARIGDVRFEQRLRLLPDGMLSAMSSGPDAMTELPPPEAAAHWRHSEEVVSAEAYHLHDKATDDVTPARPGPPLEGLRQAGPPKHRRPRPAASPRQRQPCPQTEGSHR